MTVIVFDKRWIDPKKSSVLGSLYLQHQAIVLTLTNTWNQFNKVEKLLEMTIVCDYCQKKQFTKRIRLLGLGIVDKLNSRICLANEALYCYCLGFNALLALLTKDGGNKGIKSKKGAKKCC